VTRLEPRTVLALQYPEFLIDSKAAETYRIRGLEQRNQDNFDGAIAQFQTARTLDPFNPDSYVLLGWTQHLAGQRQQAAATLTNGLEYDDDYVPSLNALGIVYLVQGQLDQAVQTHARAIALQPDNEIAHYNLSLAYERLQDYPAAIAHAKRATQLEPYNHHPWVALALAAWGNQDAEAAQSAYGEAVRLDGRYRDRAFLDHLSKAGFSPEQIETTDQIRAAL
jgi:tetratricopeptide (TPR) repeat protein